LHCLRDWVWRARGSWPPWARECRA
jgi:hypothetical protein